MSDEPVLSLRDFRVTFPTMNGDVQAVRGVDLDVLVTAKIRPFEDTHCVDAR